MKVSFQSLLIVLACFAGVHHINAQGTAFTYQGRLNASGSPANGNYDLSFSVFTTGSGGSPVAGPLTNTAVGVTNGLFTVTLDFGAGVFTGSSNWLDISVRPTGGGIFADLTPRQLLTPTPYAIAASSISSQNLVIPNIVQAAIFGNANGSLITGTGNTGNAQYSFTGGLENNNSGVQSFLGGGALNTVTGLDAFLGAGQQNQNAGLEAVLGGGTFNMISSGGTLAVIGGGDNNQVSGAYATVPGGYGNVASGLASFAAGAFAQATNQGAFVWADSQNAAFASTNNDSFNVRAQGGVRFFVSSTSPSDGNTVQFIDEGFTPGMVISNNNVNTGHLRFRNYLEVWPNLAQTTPGGIDVRGTNGVGTILVDGGSGTIYASNFQSIAGNGTFNYGIANVVTGTDSFVGGDNSTNNSSAAVVAGGQVNEIQSGSDTSVIAGGYQNIIFSGSLDANIAGGGLNYIGSGAGAATIGGGFGNTNGAGSSVISGGRNNIIQPAGFANVIGGGQQNIIPALAVDAAIVGGQMNTNASPGGIIGGGLQNLITSNGFGAVIGGGALNVATTNYTTIPGGSNNLVSGALSFAAGANAQATNQGAFVWSDSQGVPFASTNNDSFNVRAQGGVRLVTGGAGLTVDGGIISGSGNVLSSGEGSSVSGTQNTNQAGLSVISGGSQNVIMPGADDSVIVGGQRNVINAEFGEAFIGGGILNNNSGSAGVIGGGVQNTLEAGTSEGVIGGGELNTNDTDNFGTIAGGGGNITGGQEGATIGGGLVNTNNGFFGTVSGGISNLVSGNGTFASVGGGHANQATATYATVPGGSNNLASGVLSFAAGGGARATNQGSFVWSDSQGAPFASTNNDSFNVRAHGGVRLFISSTNSGEGNTVQFIDEGVVPGMVISNNNGNTGHLRVRNYLEIQPNLAGTTSGGLDVRNAGGTATVVLNGQTGQVSATTFSGSGSGLTGLPAGNLTGSLPAISGAALTSLPAASLTGALPAISGFNLTSLNAANLSGALPSISGANLTALPSGVALLNGNNQIFTGTNYFSGTGTYYGTNTFETQTLMSVVGDFFALSVTGARAGGFGSGVVQIVNTDSGSGVSPALRVATTGTGNSPAGALSVSSTAPAGTANSIIAQFGNPTAFVCVITNDGSIYSSGDVYARGTKLTSDRNAKENFAALNVKSVLDKVAAMPVTQWNYKSDAASTRHIGPVAQDFYAAFGLDGDDDKHISTVDESGVALAAIQGLNEKLEAQAKEKDAEIQKLKQQNDSLAERLNELEASVKLLAARK